MKRNLFKGGNCVARNMSIISEKLTTVQSGDFSLFQTGVNAN